MSGGAEQSEVPEVTGWQLRAGLTGCALLAIAVAVAGETSERLGTISLAGTAVLLVGMVLIPSSLFSTAFLVVLCLPVLDRADSSLLRLVVLAALLHAVHLLAALCAVGPPGTRFGVPGLEPTLRRWAVSQVVSLPVLVAVWWAGAAELAGTGVSDGLEVGSGVLAALLLFATVALARKRIR